MERRDFLKGVIGASAVTLVPKQAQGLILEPKKEILLPATVEETKILTSPDALKPPFMLSSCDATLQTPKDGSVKLCGYIEQDMTNAVANKLNWMMNEQGSLAWHFDFGGYNKIKPFTVRGTIKDLKFSADPISWPYVEVTVVRPDWQKEPVIEFGELA